MAALLLGALSVAALLTACSSIGPGPLGDGGTNAEQCMPSPQGQPVTTGIYHLANAGTSAVTIQSITLPNAHGLAATRMWLLPIYRDPKNGNFLDAGAGYPYPPAFTAGVRAAWAKRRPAVGATIKPHQDLDLVFGLTRTTSKSGKSGGPVVAYTADGSSYTVAMKTSLMVAASC
jgi:hypothetical protein